MHILKTTALKVVLEKNCALLITEAPISANHNMRSAMMFPESPEPKKILLGFRGERRCSSDLMVKLLSSHVATSSGTSLFT
jgi:hypothetical protein